MGEGYWKVQVGTTSCPECGGDPVTQEDPSLWERLRSRFNLGMRAAPTLTCASGHTWGAASYALIRLGHRSRVGRIVRRPLTLFAAVRRHRTMEPVPRTYALACAVGALLGLLLDLLFGWSWWLVAIGFVVAVWLFFMSTAFWGRFRMTRHDLLEVIDPQRARAQAEAGLAASVAAGELYAYTVAGWSGTIELGGWGGGPGRPTDVALRHGDEDRWVEVDAMMVGPDPRPATLRMENLADNLLGAVVPWPEGDADEWHVQFAKRSKLIDEIAPTLEWGPGSITVGGTESPAQVLRYQTATAVFVDRGDHWICLQMDHADHSRLDLQRTMDVKPYIREPGV